MIRYPTFQQRVKPVIFKFIKNLSERLKGVERAPAPICKVIPSTEHSICRSQISDEALRVLNRLKKSGFQAYLVGGCVRDLLLGREPKDFDVVTDARPEQIRSIFKNCRLIGRRFRLAHIYFGRNIIEVATFRGADSNGDRIMENGRLLRDNVYGTLEEDVWRRDFSVNALYYNAHDFSVVDFVGGMKDHEQGVLRLIGDPEERYREDPVRMLRAIRFSSKLGFTIDPQSERLIRQLSSLLREIPPARLYDETLKLFLSGYALQNFELLRQYHLFDKLFPDTEKCLAREQEGFPLVFLAKALENTDIRINEEKPVTAYFLFAAFLWEPVRARMESYVGNGQNEIMAMQQASTEVIRSQTKTTSLPRRIALLVREVWCLQPRFKSRSEDRAFKLLAHPRFRAAFDFLVLRAITGEADPALPEWWEKFQGLDVDGQKKMLSAARQRSRRRPRKRLSKNIAR
ncbi:MAG: polynucleotide adenylyltransferase PcnB [Gammaproteobacteria bacterium]